MKLIALLPFKNEAWALPSYLSSVSHVADEIIALDDGSTDSSADILRARSATVLTFDNQGEAYVNMSARRQALLEAGRAASGTHFIWLDADEMLSADFISKAKSRIAALAPGQKLTMRWVHPWKTTQDYLTDSRSPFGIIWKDFVVCDAPEHSFTNQFLSEARTPGPWGEPLVLDETDGVVVHWQFADWETMQWKQAWYRCTELIEGTRSARRINHMYSITLDTPGLETTPLPKTWTDGLTFPTLPSNKADQYRRQLAGYFAQHGIKYFEPLQIWHITELREQFIAEVSRTPRAKTFPNWLVKLNEYRHKIVQWVKN